MGQMKKVEDAYVPQQRHWVRISRACNLKCSFCLDKEAQNGTWVAMPDIIDDLRRGRSLGAKRVVVSGGEASIHPKFVAVIGLAHQLGYTHIQTVTNGQRFCDPDFLSRSLKAGLREVTFSIHGHTAELHDAQTKLAGSFDKAIEGLKHSLKVRGLIVSVDIVINKTNVKQLREILDFFIGLGVREFDLLQVIPFANAWDNREELFYDIPEHLPQLRRAFELSRRPDLHIWTNRFPPKFLEGYEHLIQPPKKLHDEVEGERIGMFRDFIERDTLMPCHGERCQFCYLNEHCQSLVALKKDGEIRGFAAPACLPDEASQEPEAIFRMPAKAGDFDPHAFVEFFITHRYFLKGSACKSCRRDGGCAGAQVDFIKKNGYQALQPLPSAVLETSDG